MEDAHHRGPLAGVKVIEAAIYLAGPFAGMMLADLGAEVVKIEHPKGDPFRRFGRPSTAFSPVFANCNRSKQSVALDLKDPAGRARLLGLLAESDVFLANWRAGVADGLGLSDDVLTATNPRLVRCFVTGYGPDGPLSSEPAFDTVLQGRSALSDALVGPGRDPVLIAGFPVDKLVAMMAAQAILAALFERERTGTAERIEVSMLDVASYINFCDLFTNRVFVDHQPDVAENLQASAIRPVRARDGWIVCAPVTGNQIRATFAELGHPEFVDEVLGQPDQASVVASMFECVERATKDLTIDEALARFRAADVPAGPCLTIDEHFDEPQVRHAQLYQVDEWPGLGRVRHVRYPAVFGNWGRVAAPGVAPVLDAHGS
ncbi:MAG TPA: CoA transferase [Acidimicrobiia bacterium]|nr:CoA transferase [Acidimicrobiia bacterium]